MKLSVIIPTCGRDTLIPLVNSLVEQMVGGLDEIIVVADGFSSFRSEVSVHSRVRNTYTKETGRGGNHQRNAGMTLATGTHLAFLDDDDAVSPNYIKTIKANVADEHATHLFRIEHSNPHIGRIWKDRVIQCGNVSTQMIVVPNKNLPSWKDNGTYETDLLFLQDCLKFVVAVFWHEEVIAFHNGGTI